MILYLAIIIVSMILITILNFVFGVGDSFWTIALWVFIITASEIVVDSIFATIGRWLIPKKLVSIEKKWLSATKKEARFYEKLGIKRWKDKTLDLGAVTGFPKKKLGNATDNEYVERFILEANYGVIVHILCMVLGFVVIFFCPKPFMLTIGLPVFFVNFLLNGMSLMILRYNLPKLHVLYKFNQRKGKLKE